MTDTEKALNYYKSAFLKVRPDFVPARILLAVRVQSDFPLFSSEGRRFFAERGEHDCKVNQYGAVSVMAVNGQSLGIKPGEFEVVEWTENIKS